MAKGAVAAGFFRAFEAEQSAFFEVNKDRLGGAAKQAGGEGLKMRVVPDDQHGLARTGQAESHGARVFLGSQAGGFHKRRIQLKFFLENLGGLHGAHKRAMPDFADIQLNFVLSQKIGEVFNLFFALAGEAPGGVRLTRFGVRMT